MNNTDIVILSGGKGTRLRSVVSDRPKTMADMNGRPFMDLLIGYVASFGFNRFIICTGHRSNYIEDHYASKSCSRELVISKENKQLGTAGAIKNAENDIKSNPFLVFNGDSFCSVDLAKLICFHLSKKSMLTIVVTEVKNIGDFGSIILNETSRIIKFDEKKYGDGGLVNAGIYLFDKRILSLLPSGCKCSLEKDIFPKLTEQSIYGFYTDAKLIDIGTPQRYKEALNCLR